MDLINTLEELTNTQSTSDSFVIHFDLDWNKHELPIQQSIISEQSIYAIIQELNKQLFNNELDIRVLVYPTEEGGYVKTFWLIILSLVGPSILNGFVMWLWDGRSIEEYTKDWIVWVRSYCKTALHNFLEKRNQDLTDKGISYDTFYKAYDAKNKFYHAALDNPDVKNIWFSRSNVFPIPRNEFAYRTVDLKEKVSDIWPVDKFHKLIVISSINTKEDSKLTWHVKDETIKKKFEAYMKDITFYESFLLTPIYLKTLLVKMRYYLNRDENWDIQIEKKEITKVYKYNDVEVCNLPQDAHIEIAPWWVNKDVIMAAEKKNTKQNWSLFEEFD